VLALKKKPGGDAGLFICAKGKIPLCLSKLSLDVVMSLDVVNYTSLYGARYASRSIASMLLREFGPHCSLERRTAPEIA